MTHFFSFEWVFARCFYIFEVTVLVGFFSFIQYGGFACDLEIMNNLHASMTKVHMVLLYSFGSLVQMLLIYKGKIN